MPTSVSLDSAYNNTSIGVVFTPLSWAIFAIEQYNLFDKWISGASVFDPTMGEGNLIEAFVAIGIKKGIPKESLPIERLFGVEINTEHFDKFFVKMKEKYGVEMPMSNFVNKDIFFLEREQQFDIVLGNPPWQNFNDLPDFYKENIKPQFFLYDLITNAKEMLLGGSRIDIAALVIQKVIQKNIKENGEAFFFMPLSLLLNDGAHKTFRTYKVNNIKYFIDKIFDFNNADIFGGVATRYGLVHFSRDKSQEFPIDYQRWENNTWVEYEARPLFHATAPLSIYKSSEKSPLDEFDLIVLKKASMPRQGANTCGANHIFFFDTYQEIDGTYCKVGNKKIGEHILPIKYIFPLVINKNFKEKFEKPQKWVLLPYQYSSKPLELSQIIAAEPLKNFLFQFKTELENRNGVLINVAIQKGYWWALLGIGDYNFFPYKIIWEAYGKTEFTPKLFEGNWQANQSLQAFIPLKTEAEAKRILSCLQDKKVENYLLSLKMEGTMNWAQPGKIKKLIKFEEDSALTLF
jgi:hypothetical protein